MNSNDKANFLQLLRSQKRENIELALQLAKGNAAYQNEIDKLVKIHDALFSRPLGYSDDLEGELTSKKLSDLNTDFCSYVENNITYLPAEIDQLIHLTSLHISSNSLKELPKEIGHLAKLEELWMGRNQITHLPKEIGQLQNLVYWDLPNNKIEHLPASIGNLRNLKDLDISNNQLKSIPQEVSQLKQLKELGLEGNPIPEFEQKKIQDWLPNCKIWF
ncbi:hypothetical protein BKI52_27660 [marine bacterium AO1-C]|nr:hypothetical protein BKI52_27660 [marine bacterium AO1-C]